MTGGETLRVLALCDHLGHSGGRVHGGTTYYVTTFPALRRAGVELTVCFMTARHPAAAALEEQDVRPVFLNRGRWDPRAIFDVLRLARQTGAQVLHLASMRSHMAGCVAARLLRRRAIVHVHDANPLPPGVRFVQRRLARWTHLGLAISEPIRQHTVQEYGIDAERVAVLPNGIDLSRFRRPSHDARHRVRAQLGLEPDHRVVATIGRLVPEKGQAHLLRAMKTVAGLCPGSVLVIVGAGPAREGYEAMVEQLGLGPRVRFAGQRNDVPDVLAACDVVAVPSMVKEGFGFSALEAIAAGKPVLAFNSGALPDIVVDGRTGLLVPRGDEDALAAALCRLLHSPALCLRLGEAGQRHAHRFALDRHIRDLIALYRTVIGDAEAPIRNAQPQSIGSPS